MSPSRSECAGKSDVVPVGDVYLYLSQGRLAYNMKKRHTIFMKYLCISMVVIFFGFSLLGIMTVYFATQYWKSDKWDSMHSNAVAISLGVSENLSIQNGEMIIGDGSDKILSMTMETLSASVQSDIFITNMNGEILFFSENAYFGEKNTIDKDIINRVMQEDLFEVSTLDGLYNTEAFTVGVPIKVMQDEEPLFVGAVFVTNSFSNYSDYVMTLVKIFCSAAIVTFALVFCFVGLFSYRLTKPLQQMSRAAKAFGNGDFSKRVRVDGNDEIAELAKAFNNMADSLSVSEGMRRTFIANVSHELKTPMTTIAGFIDGILDGTIPRERERHYLNIVTVEVKRLSRLVTSMLALSRIDSGELKMVRQSFDVSATVLNTFLTFEQKIEQRSITVTGFDESEPLFVEGDPDMIHQVVYNLVENATKFTNEGGSINVSVANEGNRAVVAIRNTGPGISSEQIGFVFDRFYKTDKSRSHDKNGMGLGLYLVKTIVQLHGGEITAESVEGECTTFTFWLPKRKETAAKKRSVQREEKSAVRAVQSEDEKENYSLDDSNQQEG